MKPLFGLKCGVYTAYDAQNKIEALVEVTSVTHNYAIVKFPRRHYVHLTDFSDVQVKRKYIIFN